MTIMAIVTNMTIVTNTTIVTNMTIMTMHCNDDDNDKNFRGGLKS